MDANESVEREAFKAGFPLPEFMDAGELKFLNYTQDINGDIWAFVLYPQQFAHSPWSVRTTVCGEAIELAIRPWWSDEDPEVPAGEHRFVSVYGNGDNPVQESVFEQAPKYQDERRLGAIPLPFLPTSVRLVDR